MGCTGQYGEPSGHSMLAIGLPLAFELDYNARASTFGVKARIRHVATLCLILVFGLSIAYSRLFVGVHSINQVLFGLQLGVWFALSAHFIAREAVISICDDLLNLR